LPRPSGTRQIAYLVATFGNVGRAPLVPGTFGTLAAVPVAYALALLGHPLLFGLFLSIVVVLGIWSAGVVEEGEGITDPTLVVVDEVAGFLVTVAFLPPAPLTYLSAFFLFRILDITKPPPARWAEKFHGGLGIMADDLIVGVYGNLILRAGLSWIGRS
jgi:phosphatidylglycerophosphatase A